MTATGFNDVTLTLGGRDILAGVDLARPENAFIGVLGPNGAGKTTMMRGILGLLRPTAGIADVLGPPATRGNPSVGYMPQTRAAVFAAGLSGWDFVAAAVDGHRWGLPILDAARRRDVHRVRGLVGASDLARRPLAELSGGERQRLIRAKSLLGRPRLLLLDEPLISLDPPLPARDGRVGEGIAEGTRPHRVVQRARTQPAARRTRLGSLPWRRACGSGNGRRCNHRSGAVPPLWVGD